MIFTYSISTIQVQSSQSQSPFHDKDDILRKSTRDMFSNDTTSTFAVWVEARNPAEWLFTEIDDTLFIFHGTPQNTP